MIKSSIESKLAECGFYLNPLPHPQVLLDGAPLKKTLGDIVASRRDRLEEKKPENSRIINESTGELEWPEFWAVASGDQHAKQARESQLNP